MQVNRYTVSDPFDDEKQEEELDPAVQRVQERLRRLMLRSSLIMVLGLGAVIAAIIYKINEDAEDETTAYVVPSVVTEADVRRAKYPLPTGSRIVDTSLSGDNLAVSFHNEAGGGVLLIHVPSWQVYSVIDLPQN